MNKRTQGYLVLYAVGALLTFGLTYNNDEHRNYHLCSDQKIYEKHQQWCDTEPLRLATASFFKGLFWPAVFATNVAIRITDW